MRKYKSIWERYRKAGKPVIVLEVGGLRRNISFKIGINGINRDADFANQTFDDQRWPYSNTSYDHGTNRRLNSDMWATR